MVIAPDNQTYIICDRDGHRIVYGTVNLVAGTVSETQISTGANSYPINVAIAPDGETVLVATALTSIPVLRITGTGTVVSSGSVMNVPQRQMSFAFSQGGQIAYFTAAGTSAPNWHTLSRLQINSPGDVTLGAANIATLPMAGTDRLVGTDVLAIYPNGSYALVGNQLLTGTIVNYVSLVNLTTNAVSQINTSTSYPVAIDINGNTGVSLDADCGCYEVVWTDIKNNIRYPYVYGQMCLDFANNTGYWDCWSLSLFFDSMGKKALATGCGRNLAQLKFHGDDQHIVSGIAYDISLDITYTFKGHKVERMSRRDVEIACLEIRNNSVFYKKGA